jgi:hypothetical protein
VGKVCIFVLHQSILTYAHHRDISSSTHNTRIERLWVELGSQVARRWRAFFTRLERLHRLDPARPEHLWLLHVLFLEDINRDCEVFRDEWNHHSISGIAQDQTPSV